MARRGHGGGGKYTRDRQTDPNSFITETREREINQLKLISFVPPLFPLHLHERSPISNQAREEFGEVLLSQQLQPPPLSLLLLLPSMMMMRCHEKDCSCLPPSSSKHDKREKKHNKKVCLFLFYAVQMKIGRPQ